MWFKKIKLALILNIELLIAFRALHVMTLPSAIMYHNLVDLKKSLHRYQKFDNVHSYNTRNNSNLVMPAHRLASTNKQLFTIRLFNSLPDRVRNLEIKKFKSEIKKNVLLNSYYDTDGMIFN